MSEPCIACGQPSTKLCDYVFGFQIVATLPHPAMDSSAMWTCDAPLCDDHAQKVGFIFCCDGPQFNRVKPVSGHDTIDMCPLHRDTDHTKAAPMFECDAQHLRHEAHVQLRRMFLKLTPPRGDLKSTHGK